MLSVCPVDPLSQVACLGTAGLGDFHAWDIALYDPVVAFIPKVVIHC